MPKSWEDFWTPEQMAEARRMRGAGPLLGGMGYKQIATALGRSHCSVRHLFRTDEERKAYRARLRKSNRAWSNSLDRTEKREHDQQGNKIEIPAEQLADRERRRFLDRETLTSMLCGDPLPGYSALDRRK